ncbi:MAG: glutamate racemase [Candidatus Komeilibacteria bacterium]|nr:glutamate racemase [Candidatus Komeilibacteria bacterium]
MIGVFDSGFGGLTVLKEILKKLPQYSYVYLGDNARAPYGARSQEVIYRYTKEAVDYLFKSGCQLVILACNTASAESLRRLQQEYLPQAYPGKSATDPARRILGVVIPLAQEAAKLSKAKRVGVIGTEGTIASGTYVREIKKIDSQIKVFQQACSLLVPLIEAGWQKRVETKMILKKYLRNLKSQQLDLLILGCTHYPVLLKEVRRIMGKRVLVPNPGEVVANRLVEYLKNHSEIEGQLEKTGGRCYLTTDQTEKFSILGSFFLGHQIQAEKIVL